MFHSYSQPRSDGIRQTFRRKTGTVILQERTGDLFSCPSHYSIAHCVSEDLAMGKGIAAQFIKRFGGLNELRHFGKNIQQSPSLFLLA